MTRHKNTNMPMGSMKKAGGKVQTSADTARKLATEMGGMKKGGKPKSGLAVMIAIGSPMKGMKKPVKKMAGGMASMIPAPDGPPEAPMDRQREFGMGRDPVPQTINPARMPGQPGAAPSKVELQRARVLAQRDAIVNKKNAIKSVTRNTSGVPLPINRGPVPAGADQMKINRGPVPIAKGGAVKKPDKFAQGGAGKVRKGMMTPEGKIIHAMNKVRGK
jgi:hypothetical protein